MTPPPATAERLALDAAALVRAASPNDWPGGFVVIPDRLPGRVLAVAVGTGRGVGELYGVRGGRPVVVVDVEKLATRAQTPAVAVESSTLHEAAHTLTATADATVDEADELVAGVGGNVETISPQRVARQHCPRWAAALWLLTERAAAYRPRTGDAIRERVAEDLARYGYQPADLERLAAGVTADEPLAERLAVGGAWQSLLVARLPDETTRGGHRGVRRGHCGKGRLNHERFGSVGTKVRGDGPGFGGGSGRWPAGYA